MMNAIPGTYYLGHLASPFHLIHGVGHNKWTWIPMFSLCYFHHKKDSDQQCSQHQADTMDACDWLISHLKRTLGIQPAYKQFYEASSYCIKPYLLPTSVYPDIKYDSSLFCYLICNKNPHMEKKYPPRTQIEQVILSTNTLLSGTIMDISFPATSPDSLPSKLSYTILFDNCTTASIPLQDMALLIPPPPVNPLLNGDSLSCQDSLLMQFL
jgi:hypothetical protein